MIDDAYFERFDTKKYRSKSRVKRALIKRFVSRLHDLFIEAQPVQRILEIGVGEGFLSGYLSERFPEKSFTGIDIVDDDLAKLRAKFPRIDAKKGSVYDLAPLGAFDLVLCCEVLEHLEDPGRALDEIAKLAPRRAIFTVPHEPFFMLSNLLAGKNVTRLGNDEDHHNHWGPRSFEKLLATRFDVLRLGTSYPWVLALAAPR